jgi:hypothetical protein
MVRLSYEAKFKQRLKKMEPKLAANYRHFTRFIPHDTKIVHPHAIHYGSYGEDTAALTLSVVGLALMAVATIAMLVAFSIF